MSQKNRKGQIAISNMQGIILVVISLAILLAFHTQIWDFLKNFGFSSEFKIEKEVIDSVNGLRCALASVANNYEIDKEACSESNRFTGNMVYADKNKVKFGKVKVWCDKAQEECYVENFYLPQKVDENEIKKYLFSYEDPKYLVYYEMFPRGEEKAWIQQGENDVIALAALSGAFNALFAIPGTGKVTKEMLKTAIEKALTKRITLKLLLKNEEKELERLLLRERLSKKEVDDLLHYITTRNYDSFLKASSLERKKALKFIKDYELTKSKQYLTPIEERMSELFDEMIDKNALDYYNGKWIIKSEGKKIVKEELTFAIKNMVDELKLMDSGVKKQWITKGVRYAQLFWKEKPTSLVLALEEAIISENLDDYINVEGAEEIENLAKCETLVKGTKLRVLCLATVAWGYKAARIDAFNEKYKNTGFNTLGIYSPYMFLSNNLWLGKRLAKTIPLDDSLEPYMIVLDKNCDTDNYKNYKDKDDIRFYLVSPCKADLVIKKGYGKIKVPVCYAWKENLKRISEGYRGNKKEKKLKNFLNDVCIQGNTEMFADFESQENAELFCYCIPDELFVNNGLDPKQRFFQYDPETCKYFLENPALFYINAFDTSCNKNLKEKYVFYNAEQLDNYVLWEKNMLEETDKSNIYDFYFEYEGFCSKSGHFNEFLKKVKERGLNVYSYLFLFGKNRENDIKSLQSCYYNPYYDNFEQMYIQSYELMKINNDYKFVKTFKERDEFDILNPFDNKEKRLTESYDLVSLLPVINESDRKDYAFLNLSMIFVKVNKKEGFCYTPYDNSFIRTIMVYAPFAVVEGLLSFTGVGTIPAIGLHFVSGFVSEVVDNYYESKAKWPKGEGMFQKCKF